MLKINIYFTVFFFLSSHSFVYATHSIDEQKYEQNYVNDYKPTNQDGTINAVIEIPAGTNEKWEVTKPDGKLVLEHKKGKLIGVLKFSDKGEKDDKLLAVIPNTAFQEVDNITQLDETFPGVTSIIKTWFLYYKGSGKMIFKGFGSVQEAQDILNIAIKEYQNQE